MSVTADVLIMLLVGAPSSLFVVLGAMTLFGRPLSETAISRWTHWIVGVCFVVALYLAAWMLASGTRMVTVDLGNFVSIEQLHFHLRLKLICDWLSLPFLILSFGLLGTISAFASRYLHRESGYARFHVYYAMFTVGIAVATLAGTIEVLFFGWELVGLSSAMLVAFFHERESPVQNGLRVWSVYRLADAAFLIAAVALHHATSQGDFGVLLGAGSWPDGQASLTNDQALFIGSLLLVAATGKSALVPLSGWLPRAMEGPTPSSAIFYGALSVHLGAFLLLRVCPILDLSTTLTTLVVLLGLATAALSALAARVQTDVKSGLAYASLTQVGIIIVEIGIGFRYLALAHIIGHACLRSLQLLRAPTLLHDYHTIENAIGGALDVSTATTVRTSSAGKWHIWLYRLGFERGFLDAILDNYVVTPFMTAFRWLDSLEQRWCYLIEGESTVEATDPLPLVEEES